VQGTAFLVAGKGNGHCLLERVQYSAGAFSADTGFGGGTGRVEVSVASSTTRCNAVAIQHDGAILYAGAVDKANQVLDGSVPAPKHLASPVERAFRPMLRFALLPEGSSTDNPPPTQLSQYVLTLGKLVGALSDLRDAETGTDPRKVSDVFQDAVRSTSALLSEQDPFTRPLPCWMG
jgi:hypothetical protein